MYGVRIMTELGVVCDASVMTASVIVCGVRVMAEWASCMGAVY